MLSVAIHTLSPAWYIVFCLLTAAGMTWLLYRKNTAFGGVFRWLLPALRFTGVFLLCVLLLSPFVRLSTEREEKPALLVYLDVSASVSADSGFYQLVRNELKSLESVYTVRTYTFSAEVRPADSLQRGFFTDLGAVAAHVNDFQQSRKAAAVLVFSDGIMNRGINPLLVNLVRSPKLYAVGLGDTQQYADLQVTGLQLNESVFLGSEFPVEASLLGKNMTAASWTATLLEDGKPLQKQQGSFGRGNGYARLSFTVRPAAPGIHRYTVAVTSTESEKNTYNNQAAAVTEVVDSRRKVALVLHSPTPDAGVLSRVLADNARYALQMPAGGVLPDAGSADVFILHGIPANDAEAAWLDKLKKSGKPIWMIASLQTRLPLLSRIMQIPVPAASGKAEDVMPVFNSGFSEFAFEAAALKQMRTWPPLRTAFGRFEADASMRVMLNQRIGAVETGNPLMAFKNTDKGRFAILYGEGIWRWRMKELAATAKSEVFDDLVNRTLQYITANTDKELFKTRSTRSAYDPGEPVVLLAENYDAAMNADNRWPCAVSLRSSDGTVRKFDMARNGKGYRVQPGNLPPGDYRYEAVLGSKPERRASYAFSVIGSSTEVADKVANHQLLRQWASRQGGTFHPQAAWKQAIEQLKKDPAATPVIFNETSVTDIIQLKWFFALIVSLFAAEWLLRKYLGGY